MEYIRLSEGLFKYELIPVTENIWDRIKDPDNKDYYRSLFLYNDEHYKQWKATKTVAGIKDVVTKKLFFDFDNSDEPEMAKQDAIEIVSRLLTKGIPANAIQISFSGNKGFAVEVDTDTYMSQEEFKNITSSLAGDLKTFDKVVSDTQRIVRISGTKHPKSKLYKFPISFNQLSELPVANIKELAKDYNNVDNDVMEGWTETKLPESLRKLSSVTKVTETKEIDIDNDLDLSRKPKWLSPAKFALQEGYFGSGERNTAFMVLASTYKNQGFPKEVVYRMLKGVAEIQASRNNVDRYADKELYNNVVEVVFSPTWKGGVYSYENTPLLQEVTDRLGLEKSEENKSDVVEVGSVVDIFKRFALDIDKNTIKLGIKSIDDNVAVTTSMLVGLLAAPSAGKTSVSLSILNSNSNRSINSIFFSLDMGAPLVFQRLIQKHTGLSSKDIYKLYKNNDKKVNEFENIIKDEYKNVKFCFKSGMSVEHIKQTIVNENEKGNKIRLVVLDYLECIAGPFSDSTANTSLIAQQLKDIANELELTLVLLLQPQKHAGDPSDELLTYRNIKGSSAIEQAASVIFTMWRPGFSPKLPGDDRFLSMAVVKNRMGQLGKFDFSWDGIRGKIDILEDWQKEELDEIIERKASEKESKDLI